MLNFLTPGKDPENTEDNSDGKLLPPPVRRLVFGEKSEEEELKDLAGDFYDQLERMEEAHDSHYEKLELEIDGSGRDNSQAAEVKLKKKSGDKPVTRSGGFGRTRKNKTDTNYDLLDRSFTLTELMNSDRNYLVERGETETDTREEEGMHSTTVEVEKGDAPSTSELMDEDTPDSSDAEFESPLKSSSDEDDSSVKENILDHTG